MKTIQKHILSILLLTVFKTVGICQCNTAYNPETDNPNDLFDVLTRHVNSEEYFIESRTVHFGERQEKTEYYANYHVLMGVLDAMATEDDRYDCNENGIVDILDVLHLVGRLGVYNTEPDLSDINVDFMASHGWIITLSKALEIDGVETTYFGNSFIQVTSPDEVPGHPTDQGCWNSFEFIYICEEFGSVYYRFFKQ